MPLAHQLSLQWFAHLTHGSEPLACTLNQKLLMKQPCLRVECSLVPFEHAQGSDAGGPRGTYFEANWGWARPVLGSFCGLPIAKHAVGHLQPGGRDRAQGPVVLGGVQDPRVVRAPGLPLQAFVPGWTW